MNYKTTRLRDAIAIGLLLSTSATTGIVVAQDGNPSTAATTTLDRIEVTGSRIPQVQTETVQPVQVITRADIEKQGFQSVADILQNVSAIGAPTLSRASPLSAGELAGGSYISLRNMGAQRTLVLVNGKRLGISTSGYADVSSIPAAAVERIEVLKDGASAIYGSDAIAGVINIITRTNHEGASASAYLGQYSEGDGAVSNASFIMGFTGERGSLTAAAEWRKEEVVHARDRPYSAFPRSSYHPTDNWSAVGAVGGFTTTRDTAVPGLPAGTRVVLRPGGDPRNIADYVRQNMVSGTCAGATAAVGCTPGVTTDKSNTNLQTDLHTPLESRSLYVDGVYDINDHVRFRGNLLYSNRDSERSIAGYPMQAQSFPGTGMAANSAFNPTGKPINNWWRRTWEVPRISTAELTTYRFSGGFEGSFEFAERTFDWDVGYLHNTNKQLQSNYGNLNVSRTGLAVGPSFVDAATGLVVCGTADDPSTVANERNVITGCVPFNPLLRTGSAGPGSLTNNKALQDYLFQEEHARGETKTEVITANLVGTLFKLPAGDLGFAFGLENRKESGEFVPDAMAVTGNSTNLASGPTRGGYSVDEAYLELSIPVLADLPFAKELTVSLASRYSDYDTFGDTTNNKIGLKWKPIESFLIRATLADGFRAPTISDLYGGGSQTFSFFTDPCDTLFGSAASNPTTLANCINGVGGNGALGAAGKTFRQAGQGFGNAGAPNTQTPVAFTSGSNPNLTPETSESKNIGFVWSPGFAPGLNLGIDWWNIRIENTIVSDSPGNILNDCYVQGIASRCVPSLFVRDPVRGYPVVTYGNRNAGYREAEGFDVDVGYSWDTDSFGKYSISSSSTYTSKDIYISTNDPRVPLSSIGSGSQFRIRSNFSLGWDYGAFGVSWMARYYSAMKETCTYFVPGSTTPNLECNEITYAPTGAYLKDGVTPASSLSRRNRTGSNTFNDVQLHWEAPWDATLAVGANNVFGRVGPVMYTQPSANVSYYGGFDIGRFLYMKYSQRF